MRELTARLLPWLCIMSSSVCEVVGGYYMKKANNFRSPRDTVVALFLSFVCGVFTIVGLENMGLSVVWPCITVMEVTGSVVVGVLAFGEVISVAKLIGMILSLSGIFVLVLVDEATDFLPGIMQRRVWPPEAVEKACVS